MEQIDLMLKAQGKEVAMNFRRIGELQAEMDALKNEVARLGDRVKG